MSNPVAYLWRHPRRTGFIILNLVVLAALLGWGTYTTEMAKDGLGGLPNVMLGYTGMTLLIVLWVVSWLAWGWHSARREIARHRSHPASQADAIPAASGRPSH